MKSLVQYLEENNNIDSKLVSLIANILMKSKFTHPCEAIMKKTKEDALACDVSLEKVESLAFDNIPLDLMACVGSSQWVHKKDSYKTMALGILSNMLDFFDKVKETDPWVGAYLKRETDISI